MQGIRWVRMATWAGLPAALVVLAACMPIQALELDEAQSAVEAPVEAIAEPVLSTSDLLRGVYEPPEAKILSTSDLLRGVYELPETKNLSTSDILRGVYDLPASPVTD